ncbi:MAG TPA: SDR family oxidoreductase [Pseudonocardiaceae bacterium]|nr:SDR family oxidoreductase [Pseudonocardiaceae bacterium]
MSPASLGGATLLTGASGFLGGLVTAALLASERRRVVLPIRTTSDPAQCQQRLQRALLDYGVRERELDGLMQLATIVELPAGDRFEDLNDEAVTNRIDEVVHCAGCVDYFDDEYLKLANIDLTARLLRSSREWGVRRFVYLSTAYCSGYRSDVIPERLHPDPEPSAEPTAYTRSKRIAEWMVADSGVPFLIIRPSVVIGDSRTGKYTGKNYGLYQMWRAIEGLLCSEYMPIWHTIAPPVPLNLVHQDSFQNGFLGAYRRIGSNGIIHLVGDDSIGPTLRELCWLWADVYRPVEIHSYAGIDDVPLSALPRRQRRFLELAWKNFEIATHRWRFDMSGLKQLQATGLTFKDVTIETVARCQRRYIEGSPKILAYMRRYKGEASMSSRLIEFFSSADFREPSMG